MSIKKIAHAAVIAALYTVTTLVFQAISFGPVQFRVSEALTILPVFAVGAVPGLFIGCLLSNYLCGAMWFDIVFGSIATLLAAILTRVFRKRPLVAAAAPVVMNGLIVGPVVYFAFMLEPGQAVSAGALIGCMGTVALGEALAVYILGLALMYLLKKLPVKLFDQDLD